ncbi:MAG: alanine--tRNA ligase [Bacteroidales bacterium]
MTSKEIRDKFLHFFQEKGHKILPSAPIVVKNDPTLMFTNAGMNQFKEWFLGNTKIEFKRVANTQKCLRVSGKHNDLEEVGHDSYHHTMFEMLGNWSFGDYFKREAIAWAWELLTEVYKIDKDRIYATVFEGSAQESLSLDEESLEEWLKYLPKERVIRGSREDNFWEMGERGPCGPCSEIHIDLRNDSERAQTNGASLVNKGHSLVIEIWNLVFIQYNRKSDGSLEPLPQKHVDTGMGLERLAMALQGKKSNYDTDLFTSMIAKISELTGKKYGDDAKADIAIRVVADHIRAIAFTIADGELPSNVKAGYVIRRILRRATRYYFSVLEHKEPLLYLLIEELISNLGESFPEIVQRRQFIEKIIYEEELLFLKTLDRGIKMIEGLIDNNSSGVLSGTELFSLYDTYGFPIDLSRLIAAERGIEVDLEGFEVELEKQRTRSRKATALSEGDWVELRPYTGSLFTGYNSSEESVSIVKYRALQQGKKELYQLVFNKTPFYPEGGGQVGDSGYLIGEGEKIAILKSVKENNLHIHICESLPKNLLATYKAAIDLEGRLSTAANHTATHLLHHALREILGKEVEQKGSAVNSHTLRFDFSYYEKLSDSKLREIEAAVNKAIRANLPLEAKERIPIQEAQQMGAIALFGEKYDSEVRVVRFGESIELCGGTHAHSTGSLGLFKIISESSIAAGVRRVEATTGLNAEKIVEQMELKLHAIKGKLNGAPDIEAAIDKIVAENIKLKEEIEEFQIRESKRIRERVVAAAEKRGGMVLYTLEGEHSPALVKDIALSFRRESKNFLFAAAHSYNGKAFLALSLGESAIESGKDASKLIRTVSPTIKGGGGGAPSFATAGGGEVTALPQALEQLKRLLFEEE